MRLADERELQNSLLDRAASEGEGRNGTVMNEEPLVFQNQKNEVLIESSTWNVVAFMLWKENVL